MIILGFLFLLTAAIVADTTNLYWTAFACLVISIINLFFGFGIFAASNFGGTVSLGILISITLLVAVISNLILLPSLLLSLEKSIHKKAASDLKS